MEEPELYRLYLRRRPNEHFDFIIEADFSFGDDIEELGIRKFDLLMRVDGKYRSLITYLPSST